MTGAELRDRPRDDLGAELDQELARLQEAIESWSPPLPEPQGATDEEVREAVDSSPWGITDD